MTYENLGFKLDNTSILDSSYHTYIITSVEQFIPLLRTRGVEASNGSVGGLNVLIELLVSWI